MLLTNAQQEKLTSIKNLLAKASSDLDKLFIDIADRPDNPNVNYYFAIDDDQEECDIEDAVYHYVGRSGSKCCYLYIVHKRFWHLHGCINDQHLGEDRFYDPLGKLAEASESHFEFKGSVAEAVDYMQEVGFSFVPGADKDCPFIPNTFKTLTFRTEDKGYYRVSIDEEDMYDKFKFDSRFSTSEQFHSYVEVNTMLLEAAGEDYVIYNDTELSYRPEPVLIRKDILASLPPYALEDDY